MAGQNAKSKHYGWVMLIYLFGIFIGAIDTGILTPARTIVQNSFGVDGKTGIWMITAFTLAYASAMPILGKLADRIGRKRVYMTAVALFGTGSLICGLSNFTNSFTMLICGRVIQALGGGGIMPLATAEFGTGFPEEKRGMALGLVGGVYGIANILGATVGSAILDWVGTANWHWLFFINLPICIFVVISAILALPKGEKQPAQRIDFLGILVLVTLVLSLLYALNNLDFFDFGSTITKLNVYPFLILFALLIPALMIVEKRAADPVINTGYFKNKNIVATFLIALIVGMCMMGMVFVPQFAENALKTPSGSGGYFVTILGLFAGIGGPLGGKLVDKFGPKKVLFAGFVISLIGALYLALYATVHVSVFSVVMSLVLMGSGLGFVMGTPLNYMMLANTRPEESNSALSSLSLMRSIGTTIGPILMIGFLAQAGGSAQDAIMNLLPPVSSIEIQADETLTETIKSNLLSVEDNLTAIDAKKAILLSGIDELETQNDALTESSAKTEADLAEIENDPEFASMMADMDFEIPDDTGTMDFDEMRDMLNQSDGMDASYIDDSLSMLDFKQQNMDFDMGSGELPADVTQRLSEADVTTIVEDTVYLTQRMFGIYTPDVIAKIQSGIGDGIDGIGEGVNGIGEAQSGITDGIDGIGSGVDGISQGIDGIQSGIDGISEGISQMNKAITGINKGISGIQSGIDGMQSALSGISAGIAGMQQGLADLDAQIAAKQKELDDAILAGSPPYITGQIQGQLTGLNAARSSLSAQLAVAQAQKAGLESSIAEMKGKIKGMKASISKLKAARAKLQTLVDDMTAQKAQMEAMLPTMQEMQQAMQELNTLLGQSSTQMTDAQGKLTQLRDNIPVYFDAAEQSYIAQIRQMSDEIETALQGAVNAGFTKMYYAVTVLCVLGAAGLLLYKHRKKQAAEVNHESKDITL